MKTANWGSRSTSRAKHTRRRQNATSLVADGAVKEIQGCLYRPVPIVPSTTRHVLSTISARAAPLLLQHRRKVACPCRGTLQLLSSRAKCLLRRAGFGQEATLTTRRPKRPLQIELRGLRSEAWSCSQRCSVRRGTGQGRKAVKKCRRPDDGGSSGPSTMQLVPSEL